VAWVVDTSVLVDHVRGRQEAREAVRSRTADGVWSVTTVRAELIAGMRPEDGPAIRDVLQTVGWLDVESALADLAGRMARHYRRTHPGIGILDYLVAAGAQIMGAQLLTLNIKHFPMFPDLEAPF
jgi:predicted nucleic acid-binding protein